MRIVIAMDSFKGCLTASEACQAVACGINRSSIPCLITMLPASDGGDGLLDALPCNTRKPVEVSGPLPGMTVKALIGYADNGNTAIIESAQACGLSLLSPQQRNPLLTTTRGVGEMIAHAIGQGCNKIVIGLGGSSTNDLGMGMLGAMGITMTGHDGIQIVPCGETIGKIRELHGLEKLTEATRGIEITIACDVNNPLLGPHGAARVFAPQKGASPQQVETLERNAAALSKVITMVSGMDHTHTPGAGAAGGMGYTLMSLMHGKMVSGAQMFLNISGFDALCSDADLVITGEGRSDRQTLMGKIPGIVMKRAKQLGVKTALIAGQAIDTSLLVEAGFHTVTQATPQGMELKTALKREIAFENIAAAAKSIISQIASSTQA